MPNEERVPVADTVSELEVTVTDPTVPCVAATSELGGQFRCPTRRPTGPHTLLARTDAALAWGRDCFAFAWEDAAPSPEKTAVRSR